MAELLVPNPDGTERHVALAGKAVSLGRGTDCDVVLAEQKASRRHCRIEPKGGGWRVVDEGSANGTWLDGKSVLATKLKPGDEIEIGDTVVAFADENAPPVVREPRRPRAKKKPTPWGALFIPFLAAALAFGYVRMRETADADETSVALQRYAKLEIDRASLRAEAADHDQILESARRAIVDLPYSTAAVAALDEALHGPSPKKKKDGEAPKFDADWRADVADFDAQKTASAEQRRSRLAELLERYMEDVDAVAQIRDRLRSELASSGQRLRQDREQTFADADAALADGRIGEALEKWQQWIDHASSISPEDDRDIAQRLNDICQKASAAAREAADLYAKMRREGRNEAAEGVLSAAIGRLGGTGFDVWLASRSAGTTSIARGPTKPGEKIDDSSTRERTRALQLSAAGEQLARQRRFSDAAAKIVEAAQAVSDAQFKAVFTTRAQDLRDEAGYVAKLLSAVAAEPKKFSPLHVGGREEQIASATESDISFLDKSGQPAPHSFADLPSSVVAELIDKSAPEKGDLLAASLVLHDVGEKDAYTKWMRAALSIDDLRLEASAVHARCIGSVSDKAPVGGYMPHPKDGKSIVTADQYKAIINEAKIALLRVELLKFVDKVEHSKQAKQLEGLRKAYAKLEDARTKALAVIFDEQRYFYPYRDRWKEYAPVQKEVDDLVKAVRDAWEDTTAAKVRTDANLEEAMSKADKVIIDVQFYGGDAIGEIARIEAVRAYLGPEHKGMDLNVQNFFESAADQELLAYNAKVMKYNTTVKGCTEPEREQVKITNEYRMMFGHRRALRIHPMLVAAARGHSEDMSKLGFFDHFNPVNPEKKTPADRIKLAGYEAGGCSENIAAVGGSPEGAHSGWIHSSGHHRNILTPSWVEMGSGLAGRDWTQNYGFRMEDDWEGGVPK